MLSKVEEVGAKRFGERFAAAHEMVLSKRTVGVMNPKEFFEYTSFREGGLTEEQKRVKVELHRAQQELYLDFYRENMGIFTPKTVSEVINLSTPASIDPEVVETTFETL